MEQKIICPICSTCHKLEKISKNSVFLTKNAKIAISNKIKNSQAISLYTADTLEHLFHLFHFVPVYMYLYMYMYLFKKKGVKALCFFYRCFLKNLAYR